MTDGCFVHANASAYDAGDIGIHVPQCIIPDNLTPVNWGKIYKEVKKLGFKIAFGGTLTFKNSVQAPKVCEIADLEDILIETDCPYLTPHPYRGQTNEPKYTSLVAQKIAEIKKLSYDTVVEQCKQNALNLFKKVNNE
jgi:Tat protein secretion system quality control protein TatD with DNase activity